MAGGQDLAHDTLYRALHQPLALCFAPSLGLCKGVGGWTEVTSSSSGRRDPQKARDARYPWWCRPGRKGDDGFPLRPRF